MKFMEVLTKLVVGMGRFGDHLLAKKFSGVAVAALAFACGAGLVYTVKLAPRAKTAGAPPASAPACGGVATRAAVVTTPEGYSEKEERIDLAIEAWKNSHGGTPLGIDYDPLSDWAKPSDSKVIVLRSGRTLASGGDALYMLGAGGRVVWKYHVPMSVVDFAHVEATGLVYGTGSDNLMFILDAATGKELYNDTRDGRAAFGAVLPYGEDVCLVMENLVGYRVQYLPDDEVPYEPLQDSVMAWRGTKMLWNVQVPPDAGLQVVGSRIFAVTRTSSKVLVKEIEVPKGKL
jgi:hypothetical protein